MNLYGFRRFESVRFRHINTNMRASPRWVTGLPSRVGWVSITPVRSSFARVAQLLEHPIGIGKVVG